MDRTDVTVAAVRDVGADAIAVELETPTDFSARPGQFVRLGIAGAGTEERFYTISSPDVTETFELTISIDPDGELTPHLEDLAPGSTVSIAGPYGNAYYEGEPRILVVAGGPGVGPAVGIAERALDDGGDVAIVYRDDDPIHEDRLTSLRAREATVRVLKAQAPLDDAIAETLGEKRQVFVYGFADLLDDATAALAAAGGDTEAAKLENFG